MVQVYKETPTKYALGRRGNMEEWNTISRTLETDVELGFGEPVQRGTGEHGVVPLASGAFLGVTEANLVLPHVGDYYSQYDTVGVCESGVIGVLAGGTVAAGDPAGWDATYDSNTGGWVEADTSSPQVSGCEFETGGSAGDIVLLRVRRPVA